jgi:hypothetical protein
MNAQVVKVSRWIKRCDDSGAEYAVSECGAANFCTDMAGCVRCAEVVGSQPRGWRFSFGVAGCETWEMGRGMLGGQFDVASTGFII